MNVFINGMGVVGRFGCGTESLLRAVEKQVKCGQKTGTSDVNQIGTTDSPMIGETDFPVKFISQKALRRVDHYSRMAILAGWMALTDAEKDMSMTGKTIERMGVIVATGLGPTASAGHSRSDSAGLNLSPIQFSNSVHNAAAAYISMLLKIRGPNLSINQYDLSVPLAVQTAVDWLEEGRVTSVLVGGIDCCRTIHSDKSGNLDQLEKQPDNRHQSVSGGSAFFVLGLSGKENSLYPCIHDVRIGRFRNELLPSSGTLFLHNGSQQESEWIGPEFRQISFSDIYGVFPSSMALDIAAAVLILEKDQSHTGWLPHTHAIPGFLNNFRIRCLKKGITGDWGIIDLERRPSLPYSCTVSPINP